MDRHLLDETRHDLTAQFARWGHTAYHALRLWHALYRDGLPARQAVATLRPDIAAQVEQAYRLDMPAVRQAQRSTDGQTRKFLLALHDGAAIETVIMAYRDRFTACVSTQVGCAMGCVFCATGQMGFTRHLAAGEIVAQIRFVQAQLARTGDTLRNVVFMGMGEPLHNYDATLRAIDILTDHHGIALAPKHITVSTVGLPDAIRRLADDGRPIHLAVSLHGATDAARRALIPVAKRWSLEAIIDACRYYTTVRDRRIFFEWTLIAGENDSADQAHALGRLLRGMAAHVNLIPLNPTAGYAADPSAASAVRRFQTVLAEYDLPSTVRQRRGIDIAAGCGQLAVMDRDDRPVFDSAAA